MEKNISAHASTTKIWTYPRSGDAPNQSVRQGRILAIFIFKAGEGDQEIMQGKMTTTQPKLSLKIAPDMARVGERKLSSCLNWALWAPLDPLLKLSIATRVVCSRLTARGDVFQVCLRVAIYGFLHVSTGNITMDHLAQTSIAGLNSPDIS